MGCQTSMPEATDFPSAVGASSLPETRSNRDERVEVTSTDSPPYSWICRLVIHSADGKKFFGTGFKINLLPTIPYQLIVTSAHVTFIEGRYARRITAYFPGGNKRGITVSSSHLWAAPEYISHGSEEHDYGLILLPGNSKGGFGWKTLMSETELTGRPVYSCGFPSDKPKQTLWITGGSIEQVTNRQILYMSGSTTRMSGSPLYTWHKGDWIVIGIHSYGENPNAATKITAHVVRRLLQRTNYPMRFVIQSKLFPRLYLRCYVEEASEHTTPDGEERRPRYRAGVGASEEFEIFPLRMIPSQAHGGDNETQRREVEKAIAVARFEEVFLRMDGSKMNESSRTGGNVSYEYAVGRTEQFFVTSTDDQSVSIQSVEFPNVFIHANASNDSVESENDGGTLCCSYGTPGPTEKFVLGRR